MLQDEAMGYPLINLVAAVSARRLLERVPEGVAVNAKVLSRLGRVTNPARRADGASSRCSTITPRRRGAPACSTCFMTVAGQRQLGRGGRACPRSVSAAAFVRGGGTQPFTISRSGRTVLPPMAAATFGCDFGAVFPQCADGVSDGNCSVAIRLRIRDAWLLLG